MKGLTILILLFLGGCSSMSSLEQLEAEALVSGDWSKVEQRQRMLERRKVRSFLQCPNDMTGYCEQGFGRERCTCVDSQIIRSMLER